MKKSLELALVKAQEHSKKFPDILVRVMDKKGKRAVVTASDWIYRERVLEGYYTKAEYRNGERVRALGSHLL